MDPRLRMELATLAATLRRTRLWWRLACCWACAAVFTLALVVVGGIAGQSRPGLWILPLLVAAGGVAVAVWGSRRNPADVHRVVEMLEQLHPELRHMLSAAAEQEPDPDSGGFRYLQMRLINRVLAHPSRWNWGAALERKLSAAMAAHLLAVAAFFGSLLAFGYVEHRGSPWIASWFTPEIAILPGDAEVERGSSVVISARFGRNIPSEAILVVQSDGQQTRLPLRRSLSDPVFGTALAGIRADTLYHIEYSGRRTRDYRLDVFDYPALQRADAGLEFPAYTGLTNQTIRDTRRISVVEGTRLTYTMLLNKPVAVARLVGVSNALALSVSSNAVALLPAIALHQSAAYSLQLVDFNGRTNTMPAEFSLQVLTNRRPDLRLVFPRGDTRVSPLEEVQLRGEVSDDFGLLRYGLGFGVAGKPPTFLELGRDAGAHQKRRFEHLVPLESLNVEPDQVVCYFLWADDYGPDGVERRNFGDMYFAEVRPFEEIFRPDQAGGGGGGQQQGGGPGAQLAELQKQIVIATWKLQGARANFSDTQLP